MRMQVVSNKTHIPAKLIERAKNGDTDAINKILDMTTEVSKRMLSKYRKRNILIDEDDLLPIFLHHVYENISIVRLDIGDPGEFLISQALNKTMVEVAKSVKHSTEQRCKVCGNTSRINYGRNAYSCPHPNEACNCDTTICRQLTPDQVDKGMRAKTKVAARYVTSDGQVACRCAKRLNQQYYCMRDFRMFLDSMVTECNLHKSTIIGEIAAKHGIVDAEKIFANGMSLVKIQKFHAMYLPNNHRALRDKVAKNSLIECNRKPQCPHCGSFDLDVYMTGAADEVFSENGSILSITEQYVPSDDSTIDMETITDTVITTEEVQQYLDTLHGRERDVMVRLLNGMQASDIARALGVKPTCITIYKKRGVQKAIQYFIDKLPYVVTEQMMDELRSKFPDMMVGTQL